MKQTRQVIARWVAKFTPPVKTPVATTATTDLRPIDVEQLRQVVGQLERGELSLEDSLASYERGVALTRRGHDLLHAAEKRIELLVGPGGATSPLKAADDDEGDDDDRQGA